jgi:hypothetical protein
MRNLQPKKIWMNIAQSKPVLFVFFIVLLFFMWNIWRFWNKMGETAENREIAENKVIDLKNQKEKLISDIESLETEEGKERFFRENFGLVKEGEEVIIVIDEKKQPPPEEKSFSSGILSIFKKIFGN